MRHRTSTLATCVVLLALQLGCTEAAGDARPAEATTTTEVPVETIEATTTTVDAEALAAFFDAIAATTTTAAPTTVATLPPTTAAPVTAPPPPPPTVAPSGRCGALPDFICARESGFDPNAVNPTGCGGEGCYGKYQFAASTWNATVTAMGRPDLVGVYLPDEATQDAVAAYLWAGGAGCGHWGAC